MSLPTVFISYCHKDEAWKDRLVTQLGVLENQGILSLWDDRRIGVGEDWEREIQGAMDAARVAVLLISANSLTSKFILRTEVTRLLQRREREGLRIFPVIIKPVDWEAVGWLRQMQVRPRDGKPLSTFRPAAQADVQLAAIAKEVRTILAQPAPSAGSRNGTGDTRAEVEKVGAEGPGNPFVWRGGITDPEAFFDREREQSTLRAYLGSRQNCQIVGPRRIGKTSLLRQIERVASTWQAGTTIAYLDLQDARSFTLPGWLARVGKQLGLAPAPATLADFAEAVEGMVSAGRRPVLCLDEFEELTSRRGEFTRDFFMNLRSCGQQGMSIVTASQKPLSELTESGDPTSPFYNTFPLLRPGPFREPDARDFVTLRRPGVLPFSNAERAAILDFAKGHPLALQISCFHMVDARLHRNSVRTAIWTAEEELRAMLPAGW